MPSSFLRGGAVALLPLLLTACTSAGRPAAAPSGTAETTVGSRPAPDPYAGLMNGTRLKEALLTAGALPAGYTADRANAVDTGAVFATPSGGPLRLDGTCEQLNATAWVQTAGFVGASFAQADFTDARHEEFAEEIDEFPGSDADTVMTRLAAVFAHCAAYTDTSGGVSAPVTLRAAPVPGLGDRALKAVMSSPRWKGGMTLVAARVGSAVVTTFSNVQTPDLGSADLGLTRRIVADLGTGAGH